jgi:membrane protease YdiL (CAAX protease family)
MHYVSGLRSPRWRAAVELVVLAAATVTFLAVVPHATVTYVLMGLLALALVATQARDIRARFWDAPAAAGRRRRRAAMHMVLLTAPPIAFFLLIARFHHRPLLTAGLAASLALYVPWAAVQQTLFQFYLHGRLRALLPFASPLAACAITGACYGLVHLPDVRLVALTTCAGVVWSYCYQRDRWLLPIAASHALLGTTFYAWVQGQDALSTLLRAVGA